MKPIHQRPWLSSASASRIEQIHSSLAHISSEGLASRVEALAQENKKIHEQDCFNLNPATNVMNPRAEALLSSGLGSRPSLGYPGEKYETGLEAIEEIEVIASHLASEIFQSRFAEIRVGSGALANLYAFMATCRPGDSIIAPPATIAGHVTHHAQGCAGLYGLHVHHAPVNADGYTIDLAGLRELTLRVKPKLITIGQSLNLWAHPVADLRDIASQVGARLLFDAAHQCGMIASGLFANPLAEGADLMTMSTYKSLGGPAGGLILTNDPELASRLEAIAYPGLTANFDVAKSAALAVTLLDWRDFGHAYGQAMVDTAQTLAEALDAKGMPLFKTSKGITGSHQFALEAQRWGGGQSASKRLRAAGILACGIGLPRDAIEGDTNGLRLGTPEICRWGMQPSDMPRLAELIVLALEEQNPARLANEVSQWRQTFNRVHFIHQPGRGSTGAV